jgi:hypothetical protein
MTILRWILFLPAALAGGTVAAVLLTWGGAAFPDAVVMLLRGFGSAAGMMYCGMYVAPSKTRTVKWTLIVVAALLGLSSGLESLAGPKPFESAVGFSMLVSALGFASMKPDQIGDAPRQAQTN